MLIKYKRLIVLLLIILLAIFIFLFLGKSQKQPETLPQTPPPTLAGEWEAYGYFCNGSAPMQIVSIEQDNDYLRAVKTTGDDCVIAGATTWEGVLSDTMINGFMHLLGTNGQNATTSISITITDSNTLYLSGPAVRAITFKRVQE